MKKMSMRHVLVYGTVIVLLVIWGAAWTTQTMAYQLGFSEVLGAPLVRWTRQSWLPSSLTHGAAALAGASVALVLTRRQKGFVLLGAASMLLLLGSGPLYSPHCAVVWGALMQGEALVGVLWRAVGVGGFSIVWMTALIVAAVCEQKRLRERWGGPGDSSRWLVRPRHDRRPEDGESEVDADGGSSATGDREPERETARTTESKRVSPLPVAPSSDPSSDPNENRRESQRRASTAPRAPFGTYLTEYRQPDPASARGEPPRNEQHRSGAATPQTTERQRGV